MRRHDEPIGLAAQCAGRAFFLGLGDHVGNAIELVAVDDGADEALGIFTLADRQLLHPRDEFLHEFIIYRIFYDDAVGDHADLALVHELAPDAGFHRAVQIGIVQHHDRAVAAQFQLDRFDPVPIQRGLAHAAPDGGGAGEADDRGDRMADQRIADGGTGTRQHRNQPFGQARFFANGGEDRAAGNDGIAGRLDHHAIAQRQGREQRARGQLQREIPRADQRDHPGRLAIGARFLARNIFRHDRALDHVWQRRGFRAGDLRHQHQFQRGLQLGAPGLAHDPAGDLVLAGFQNVGNGVHLRSARGGRHGAPFALRLLRGLAGFIDIVFGGGGHFEDGGFVPWTDVGDRVAACLAPASADEGLIELLVCIGHSAEAIAYGLGSFSPRDSAIILRRGSYRRPNGAGP